MKKVKFERLFALLAISMTLVFTTSCEKTDVDDINPIVGVWTADTFTYSLLTVDGGSYVDFMIAVFGYTQEQAEAAAAATTDVTESIEGVTFEFKEGGTYVTNTDGDESKGTWMLVGDVLSITTEIETAVFDVTTLNASTLVMQGNVSTNWGADVDGDGTVEVVVYNFKYALTR